ncbi:hypothetical protein JTB14_032271 [Gonioctena quinquepunctata]|nr:hypothetical protein JTB14_032271 [Gonioctena quinquepunctata]
MDAFTYKITYIYMNLMNIQLDGNVAIPNIIVDVPKIMNDSSIEGSVVLSNILITGLETSEIDFDNIQVEDSEEEETFDVCVKLPVGYLNITWGYVADIAIRKKIPIYGEGNFSVYMSNVTIDICTFASYKDVFVDDVNFTMAYRHGPADISGVLKHPAADKIASRVLNIGNVLLAMWNKYEPKKASCIWNPLVQHALNAYLEYGNNSLEFDKTCLQDSSVSEIFDLGRELKHEVSNIFTISLK